MPQAISDDALNQLIATDPQIQQIVKSVWGDTPANQRPGDTPKNLEAANQQASQQIASVLQSRGIQLPKHTFINPRSAAVEHEHGWAGLPTAAKVAIIAGGALATGGALGAAGAFGGAAGAAGGAGGAGAASGVGAAGAAGAAIPSLAVAGGLPAGAFGAGIAGTGAMTGALGAAGAAGGTSMGLGGVAATGLKGVLTNALKKPSTYSDMASVLGKQQEGKAAGALAQAGAQQNQDRNAISLFQAQQGAENSAAQTDLQRKQYADTARSKASKDALMSALLGGGIPKTSISVPGIAPASTSGGMLDALKSNPDALKALATLHGQASDAQTTAPTFTGGNTVAPPSLTALPDTGQSSGFLSALANIGQLISASQAQKKLPISPSGVG